MNATVRQAFVFGGATYLALVLLYVVLVGASSIATGELSRSQWPTATYLLAGACVVLVAGWCGANGLPTATAVAIGVAPVVAVLTAVAVGTVVESLGGQIHPGFLAFFLAGTLVLGLLASAVGYGLGTLVAAGT